MEIIKTYWNHITFNGCDKLWRERERETRKRESDGDYSEEEREERHGEMRKSEREK